MCILNKTINHADFKERFRDTELACPLFKDKSGSLGSLCAVCCFRISQLIDTKKDLIYRQTMVYDTYKRQPDVIKEYLPECLVKYYEALRKYDNTIEDAERECSRCKSGINKPIINREPVKING